jgi:hypothetical protein
MGRLRPIIDLGVAEAYAILTGPLGWDPCSLPPLGAIENEDWGRDLLLSQFIEVAPRELVRVGLCLAEPAQAGEEISGESTEAASA